MAERNTRRYADRRQYSIAAVHKRRKKVRQMAVEYKGGSCERCGYNRCIEALEFHHTNSSEKDFNVSQRGYTRTWSRVKEELDKCVLLCASCRRELHALISSFHGKPWLKKRVNSGESQNFRTILSQALNGKVQRLDTRYLIPGIRGMVKV